MQYINAFIEEYLAIHKLEADVKKFSHPDQLLTTTESENPRAETLEGVKQCWYCRCADFHLDKPRSLDVGVCYWPKKIIK